MLPEQVESARNFYRGIIRTFRSNGFQKIKNYMPLGDKTTGYDDYLWAVMSLFSIIYGSNLGCRARQDYEKLPTWGFKFVSDEAGRRIGVWCLEAFVKKHGTTGKRRCPSFILDLGCNTCDGCRLFWCFVRVPGVPCRPGVVHNDSVGKALIHPSAPAAREDRGSTEEKHRGESGNFTSLVLPWYFPGTSLVLPRCSRRTPYVPLINP